jgi:hypothetical protein
MRPADLSEGAINQGIIDRPSFFRTGEQRLMVALIEDAINTLSFIESDDAKTRSLAIEAARWITGTDYEYILSFPNCCEAVGWNPEYVRRLLRPRLKLIRLGRQGAMLRKHVYKGEKHCAACRLTIHRKQYFARRLNRIQLPRSGGR